MRCLELADPGAGDAAVAGAKAAGLARARAAGLPVLPGVVIPVSQSQQVVAAAAPVAAAGQRGAARLAAMRVEPDESLVAELLDRLGRYEAPFIVRSSSPLEADGTWSGAFSSFHGVTAEDIRTAVRGCWGSAFSATVLNRAERTGTPCHRLGLAVLVQPELQPDLGGIARLSRTGTVQITTTDGPLRPLMTGAVDGWFATVSADGTVDSLGFPAPALLRTVADLTRTVAEVLGHDLIEWAAVAEQVTLLQSIRSSAPVAHTIQRPLSEPALSSTTAQRLAGLTQQFAGRLAEDLVLPWAVATVPVPTLPARGPATDPGAALAAARSAAGELTRTVWGGSSQGAAAAADRALRLLRGSDPGPALERIAALPRPDAVRVAGLLADLAAVRDHLTARRLVGSTAEFWRLSSGDVARLLAGEATASETRLGVDRWEPFLYRVVAATGNRHQGVAAAPGAGAGRALVLDGDVLTAAPLGRYVLVAPDPGPALGPLLWHAAALVTRAGSAAAHLIEFARSLGVPAVVGCKLPDLTGPARLIAVDGNLGTVSVAPLTTG